MKILTLEAEIGADGVLHLNIPVDLPPGKVEGVLVMQPCQESKKLRETGYEWLLDPKYDHIGRDLPNGTEKQDTLTHEERAKRIMELLDVALKDVTWEEIEEGRRDR